MINFVCASIDKEKWDWNEITWLPVNNWKDMPEGTMGTKGTMTLGKVEETSASSQQGLNIFQLGE